MFGNTYLTRNYLRKMQQGGGTTVFAPDPSQYRTPLQGINPAVLQYNINTKPLDTSGLIQVLQTKDEMDMAREKAAIEREKLKAQADSEKNKLQYQQMKFAMDLVGDMFKSTGDSSISTGGKSLYPNNDILNTPRFAPKLKEYQEAEDKKIEDIVKSMYAPAGFESSLSLMKGAMDLKRIRENGPATAMIVAEQQARQSLLEVIAGTKKGSKLKANPVLAKRILDMQEEYLNGADNGYELGLTINSTAGLTYNPEVESVKLKNAYIELNKPIVEEVFDDNGKVIRTVETKKTLDPKLASKSLTEMILADAGLRSYASELYNLDLYPQNPADEEATKEVLRSTIQKFIEYDDGLYNQTSGIQTNVTNQVLSSPVKTSNVNFTYSGGVNSTKKIDQKIDVNKKTTVTGLNQAKLPTGVKPSADGATVDISSNAAMVKAANALSKETNRVIDNTKVPVAILESIIKRAGPDKTTTTKKVGKVVLKKKNS